MDLETEIKLLVLLFIVFVPLGIWKYVELTIWFFQHRDLFWITKCV